MDGIRRLAAVDGREIASILRLVTGAGGAHAIVAGATPLLTRLYAPADFGQFQVFATVYAFLFVVVAFRYEWAVLLPRRDEDAATVAALALGLVVLTAISSACALPMMARLGWLDGRLSALLAFGWALPFALLGGGTTSVLTQWALRMHDYDGVGRSRLIQSSGIVSVQLGVGFAAALPAGLVSGDAFGRLAGGAGLLRRAWRRDASLFRAVRGAAVWRVAKHYWRFPVISSGSALVNTAGFVLPIAFLTNFGATPLGWFALVDRVVGAPSSLVGLAVSQVYSANAARLLHEEPSTLRRFFLNHLQRLAAIGALPFMALGLLGPAAFALLFGEEWRGAGEYARYLAGMQFIGFAIWPLMPTLTLVERQEWQLGWDVGRLVLCALAMYGSLELFGTAEAIVAAYSASMAISYLAHGLLSYVALVRR